MKRHLLNIAITASSLLALTACSDDVVGQENNNLDKSPIELSVGGVESASTRAVVTTGPATEKLQQGTGVFMLMKSEYEALGDFAFYNYGGSQTTKYATTRGDVNADGTAIEFINDQATTRTRYWDDAHARSSKLSIWAVACDGLDKLGGTGTLLNESSNIFNTADAKTLWRTEAINATSLDWNVPTSGEDETSVKNRDLIFSNNVTKYTINSVETDNRTSYNTADKKFGSSALVFYHALSKITVYLDKGEGYTSTDAFSFPDGKNIKLNYFNVGGKFNIEQGEFTEVNNSPASIEYIYKQTGTAPHAYELQALVLPYLSSYTKTLKGSQFVENNTNIMMEFSIDGSNYRLTSGALYDALIDKTTNNPVTNATQKTDNSTNYIPLEAGKNYVFTFTVTKTGIEATATVKPWDDVTANNVTPLINFSKCYGSTGDNFGKGFTFYRSTSKDNNYLETNNSSSVTYNSTGSTYTMSPKLYWKDHSTHYFFRGIWPAKATEASQTEINNGYTPSAKIKTAENKTVVAVENVGYKTGTFPSDLMIGVPRKTETIDGKEVTSYDETCKANHTTGEVATSGICATQATAGSHDDEGLIHLNFQYAMSQVEVRLTTPTTGDDAKAKVRLEGAKVEIVDGYTTGNILLGNEEAVPTGDRGNFEIPAIASSEADRDGIDKANIRHAAVVPQSLTWTDSEVTKYLRFKVTITNEDGTTDIYYTNIAPITKTGSTTDLIAPNGKWEAGTHYVYTLDIRKTGIEGITATITDWKKVTATESVWF